jgi:hypothetical protein
MSDLERHMAARYMTKWKPCVDTRKRVVKRDSTGSRYMGSSYCKHYFFPGVNSLIEILHSIYTYLYREGYSATPNYDAIYHMNYICTTYNTLISKYLVEQFLQYMKLLYDHVIFMFNNCGCNVAHDCVCEPIVQRYLNE